MRDGGGVMPLVCACCEQIVGVINDSALAQMLGNDEVYFCKACLALDEDAAITHLIRQPADYYVHLVSRAVVAATLADGEALTRAGGSGTPIVTRGALVSIGVDN